MRSTPCPSCAFEIPEGSRFCGSCGADVGSRASSATETSAGDEFPSPLSGRAAHGARFAPGTMIGARYRVFGLIGRGGMGEVYRADDLKLGRPVALKFLPQAVEGDPRRLVRFLNEARVALRVTHPNVCRVHDVAEIGGQHFLSMEYVDGEDLGTLLRRIGRLPQDRALRAARQLCSGLAAAHDQGILHRDLKPANVMIDGRGQVKITDFGLAGLAGDFEGAEVRVGTPFYMAPEQLAGEAVSTRSDIYALGLVLYELFTGQPAYPGKTSADIARGRESLPTSPASIVDGLDRAVERVILRCLERDPHDRPGSALAVAAALPGGDPLAAALAAGETPSPELVAEAGRSGGSRPATAMGLLAATVFAVTALVALSSEINLVRRTVLEKPPQVLAEKAREVIRQAGRNAPAADQLYGFLPNWGYYEHVRRLAPSPRQWDALASTQPAGMWFVYRESPHLLDRINAGSIGNWFGDPPPTRPGMTEVTLDPAGRLIGFRAVPPERAAPAAAPGEPDWSVLFTAAGLAPQRFTSVEAEWSPPTFADRRAAWRGVYPDAPETVIRVEAAAWGGLPVSFRIIEPWARPDETDPSKPGFWKRTAELLRPLWFVVVLVGASAVALRNVRLGRGDHRTALRFALYLAAVRMLWLLDAHHLPSSAELDVVTAHLAWSMYRFGLAYVFYLALEPYARRLWPQMLVSWVRLVGGRPRDPLVGRDLLIGVAYGGVGGIVLASMSWVPQLASLPGYGLETNIWSWESLRGVRHAVAALAATHTESVVFTFVGIMMFLVLRIVLRRTWIAVLGFTALGLAMFNPGSGHPLPYLVAFSISMAGFWFVLFRYGLLTMLVGMTVSDWLRMLPLTFDLAAWHGHVTLLVLLVVAALAAWGFWVALAGRPLFRDEIQGSDAGVARQRA